MSRLTEKRKIIFQFTMNYFKRKGGSTTQKNQCQLKENGKPSTSDQLLNVAAYKDFKNDDSAMKLIYPEAWKDLKPTLNITGTSVELDYTVSLTGWF